MKPASRSLARTALDLLPILAVAACASHGPVPYDGYDPNARSSRYAPSRYYPPPGPPSDPWGPYIREAAGHYKVPEQWIRAVMRQESGGREQAVSSAGAMGLMQVMPATYDMLRRQHRLGGDPFDPHNNILAGTAYIRDMYDRFGAPGFLAAYNAGPERLDMYLAGATDLPRETVNYVAAITPNLGTGVALSGPLAVYGGNAVVAASYRPPPPTVTSFAAGCDLNAAFDPAHPCQPLERQAMQAAPPTPMPAPMPSPAPVPSWLPARMSNPMPATVPATMRSPVPTGAGCDRDAAYDPRHPCAPLRPPPQLAAPPSAPPQFAAVPRFAPAPPTGAWAIQVGAYTNPGLARAVAEGARSEAQLRTAALSLPPTTPFGGTILYRARLTNLTATAAASACQELNQRQLPCMVVPPAGS